MASQEANKIAGAVLMAGLIAMASGFIARTLVHPAPLKELAFAVEKDRKSTRLNSSHT